MIIVDVETTGTDAKIHGIASLGAVDYETGAEFYQECRIGKDKVIDPIALKINGFTEAQLRDESKMSGPIMYCCFIDWVKRNSKDTLLAGHNIGHLDLLFLEELHKECDLFFDNMEKFPFGYRTVDLHSVAYLKLGKSLSHEGICEALELPKEPKPHNALNGARSERDAFKLLLK